MDPKADLQRPPFTTRAVLSDGGVYDNMGIETAWKRYTNVLVSDAGGMMQPDPEPHSDWPQHFLRIFKVINSQVRSLRKLQVISSYENNSRGAGRPQASGKTSSKLPVERIPFRSALQRERPGRRPGNRQPGDLCGLIDPPQALELHAITHLQFE